MPPDLTPVRKNVLQVTARLTRERGAPTPQEVAEALGVTRQAVYPLVQSLRAEGYLERPSNRTSPLILTPRGQLASGAYGYPLLGEVAAGHGAFTDDQVQGLLSRIDDVLDVKQGDYFLTVRGNSMVGVGIYPGDKVAVRPSEECPDGEIAVVLLPGEQTATLKRVYRHGPEIELVSENPEYPPRRYFLEDVRIRGCLVGHIGSVKSRRR